jgi:rfaE bifunctional protein nucleotidyltransferase chain/domain
MKSKKRIGFTNGCFDIVHAGHIELLQKAKKNCDYLIVGLNSDSSVRKLKGNQRPILNLKQRSKIISSIKYVDQIKVFKESTPLMLIKKIKPDIIFKGSDYIKKKVVGYDFQTKRKKQVKIIKLLKNISTTKIIRKLSK